MLRTRSRTSTAKAAVAVATATADTSVRESALKLLDRQRYTRRDLARRLREKGHDATEIEPALDRLAEIGLVDDIEYARAFIAGRWGRRAAGWRKIENDLRAKGVSRDDIVAGRVRFEAEQGGELGGESGSGGAWGADETAAAQRVVQQAERKVAKLDPRARRQRLTALLLRRGFSYETIEQVLRAT